MGIYDLDCCYLWQLGGGSADGIPHEPDGYYIVQRQGSQCVVVESNNWYAANGYGVGAVLACPDPYSVTTTRPDPPVDSDTKKSLAYEFPGGGCCNDSDGGAIYAELSIEMDMSPCSSYSSTENPSSSSSSEESSSSSSETGTDCISFAWSDYASVGGSCGSPILGGTITITIPDSYSIPNDGLLISVSLGGDDFVTFNGDRFGSETCTNGTINTETRVFTNTFTVQFFDTVGGLVGRRAASPSN